MTTTYLFVMLVLVAGYNNGPAPIPGFRSLVACEKAIPVVVAAYDKLTYTTSITTAKCVQLETD